VFTTDCFVNDQSVEIVYQLCVLTLCVCVCVGGGGGGLWGLLWGVWGGGGGGVCICDLAAV